MNLVAGPKSGVKHIYIPNHKTKPHQFTTKHQYIRALREVGFSFYRVLREKLILLPGSNFAFWHIYMLNPTSGGPLQATNLQRNINIYVLCVKFGGAWFWDLVYIYA